MQDLYQDQGTRSKEPAMLELADIFREYGDAYRQKYGERMLLSHREAMGDIEYCRTSMMGGEC